jgi:hypothetical protein
LHRQVENKDQAADIMLVRSAKRVLYSLQRGGGEGADGRHHVMCLISDDGGYAPILQEWTNSGWSTLAVCEKRFRDKYPGADVTLSWHGVQNRLYV